MHFSLAQARSAWLQALPLMEDAAAFPHWLQCIGVCESMEACAIVDYIVGQLVREIQREFHARVRCE
jgi:hypothetical protein